MLNQLENIDKMLENDQLGVNGVPFGKSLDAIKETANSIFRETLALLLQPVAGFLERIPLLSTWTMGSSKLNADIPSFGLDPQVSFSPIKTILFGVLDDLSRNI